MVIGRAIIRKVEQEIRFCKSRDGVRIAYALAGSGPPLVKAPNHLNHLEFDWRSPVWSHFFEHLAQHNRLVRFDERGMGLSDRHVENWSIDLCIDDLEAVVDAAGLERFSLLGLSQGGPFAIGYAVRHPERVKRLVLLNTFARVKPRVPSQAWLDETAALHTLMRVGWGRDDPHYRQIFTQMYIPDATLEQMRWFNELQRVSASPENAARQFRETLEINVLDLCAQVTVPTLVMHSTKDGMVPFQRGLELAGAIPGARFVPLESASHLLLPDEPAWPIFREEMGRFLKEDPDGARANAAGAVRDLQGAHLSLLSSRERQVLGLVALGLTNPAIAEALVISPATAARHVHNILTKLALSNRTELAAWAIARNAGL